MNLRWAALADYGTLGVWRLSILKTRRSSLTIMEIRNCNTLWIASHSMLSSRTCMTATRCRRAAVMSEPGINHLVDFALFLPFSCNERPQRPASLSKAETLEVGEETEKTARYG